MTWVLVAAICAVCFGLGWQVKGFLAERAEYAAEEKRDAEIDALRRELATVKNDAAQWFRIAKDAHVLPDRRG